MCINESKALLVAVLSVRHTRKHISKKNTNPATIIREDRDNEKNPSVTNNPTLYINLKMPREISDAILCTAHFVTVI